MQQHQRIRVSRVAPKRTGSISAWGVAQSQESLKVPPSCMSLR